MAIGASPRFAALLLLSHSMAVFAVCLTAMSTAARLAAIAVILSSLSYHLARDALLLSADSWRELSLDRDGMSVTMKKGSVFAATLAGGIFVSPYFIVLRLVPEGQRRAVARVIFADAMEAGDYRALCVHLRLG